MNLRAAIALMLCLALTACVRFDGIAHSEAKRDIPASVTDTAFRAWPEIEWWKNYQDPALNDLIAHALADSPRIRIAAARLRAAQAVTTFVGAKRLPQVEVDAQSKWQRFSEHGFSPPDLAGGHESDNRFAFDASYELDLFGKNRSAHEATQAQVVAAVASTHAARLALTSAVARLYFQLGRYCAEREVARATRTQRAKILELVKARVAEGVDSNVELRQAEGAIPRIEGELAELEERISLLRNALAILTVVEPTATATLTPSLTHALKPTLPALIPSDLVARRPEVEVARWRVEAGLKGIESVRAEFYPSINLSAFAGLSALGIGALFEGGAQIYGIAPVIRLPIFDADRLRAKLKFVDAQTDVSIAEYNRALGRAIKDVLDAVTSIRALTQRQVAQRAAQQAAQSAYDLALQRFKAGLTGYLTVLTTESDVLIERRAAADLNARGFELDVSLARALGGGFDAAATLARN